MILTDKKPTDTGREHELWWHTGLISLFLFVCLSTCHSAGRPAQFGGFPLLGDKCRDPGPGAQALKPQGMKRHQSVSGLCWELFEHHQVGMFSGNKLMEQGTVWLAGKRMTILRTYHFLPFFWRRWGWDILPSKYVFFPLTFIN